jgi:formylglycine-generating enzyme required for sulfatase activity
MRTIGLRKVAAATAATVLLTAPVLAAAWTARLPAGRGPRALRVDAHAAHHPVATGVPESPRPLEATGRAIAAPGERRLRAAAVARIPAGSYLPLYAPMGRVAVGAFVVDRYPVTRAEFEVFVRSHPDWRRSRARHALAGTGYLRDWRGDLDFGEAIDARRPVTWVSRPAAQAYCTAAGGRLPTADEWEYLAGASARRRNAAGDPAFQQRLLDLYTRPRRGEPAPVGSTFRNAFGVYDLHGLVWEWTDATPPAAGDAGMSARMHMPAAKHGAHDMGCAGSAEGATDTRAYAAFLRYALRAGLTPTTDLGSLGFRCAY